MEETLRILLYFIIYSFLGWVMESILKSYLQKKIINSGFLHGPICPIYGFGAIIMIVFLNKFKDNIVILFLISFVVLTIWEYIVGVLLEKIFHTKYWDYSNNKFNFQGRICLLNSFYWGVLGVLFTLVIHPTIQKYIDLIDRDTLIVINILLYIILITDTIISSINMSKLSVALEKVNDLTENIKQKLEEMKNVTSEKYIKLEELEKSLRKIKRKQIRIRIRLYKNAKRLKEAFPTMKAEKITEILNQKIDLKALKKRLKNKEK